MKMNVLVYSGDGSTVESVQHCLYTLRRLLFPNYAVMLITSDALIKEPWAGTCALLVIPGGADRDYCRVLNGEGNRLISQYVRAGGAYLGFGAGGQYGSKRCEFEFGDGALEEGGVRELAFFPGVYRKKPSGGSSYYGWEGGRVIKLKVEGAGETFRSYYTGGGVFVDADKYGDKGIQVLASFIENTGVDEGTGNRAVVYCKAGEGAAILASPQLEFAPANLNRDASAEAKHTADTLLRDDEERVGFLKTCLAKLRLTVDTNESAIPTPSLIHISSMFPVEAKDLADSWREITTSKEGEDYIICENDTFCLEKNSAELPNKVSIPDPSGTIKCIRVHGRDYPASDETPFFNHSTFYSSLCGFQSLSQQSTERFGRYMLYGEVLTSTNTMLEKNHKLLHRLPTGFTAVATLQTAGRGRGSNVWLSPLGCLLFSTCVRHPVSLCAQAPPMFIQYLAAMAIVEAVKCYDVGYDDIPVRLKWPNDIYVEEPSKLGQDTFTKIGGILVQCSGDGKEYFLVVGIGLNTRNRAPTTSLNHLLDALNLRRTASGQQGLQPFTQEKLLARILVTFEELYVQFCRCGWSTFLEDMYYKHWLHSNQVVTLETLPSAPRARILGITRDFALLHAEELDEEGHPTGHTHELQPDGNSFDFFQGLVKRKV